jgi:hypothetical protein
VRIGVENRKQLIALAICGGFAVIYAIYTLVQMGSSPSVPAPIQPPVLAPVTPLVSPGSNAAPVIASSGHLDPTLHMEAMLLTESLAYTGNGRNIFSANSAPVAINIPKPIAPVRPVAMPVTPVNMGPPPPPPIDLKFFGTATGADGKRRAFLLRGDDVFLASPGEIVSRRYKIGAVLATSIEITDLQNNNTQRIPLAQ